jgi:hypothetical protein
VPPGRGAIRVRADSLGDCGFTHCGGGGSAQSRRRAGACAAGTVPIRAELRHKMRSKPGFPLKPLLGLKPLLNCKDPLKADWEFP